MARSYEQVLKRIETLKAEAEKLRRKETADVVARIRDAIAHYELSAADLGLAPGRAAAAKPVVRKARKAGGRKGAGKGKGTGTVPVKYRDEAGHTWTGRGLHPVWLREAIAAGRTLADFAVK